MCNLETKTFKTETAVTNKKKEEEEVHRDQVENYPWEVI